MPPVSRGLLALAALVLAGCEARLNVEVSRGDALTLTAFSPRITGLILQRSDGSTVTLRGDALTAREWMALDPGETVPLFDDLEINTGRFTGAALTFDSDGGTVTTDIDDTALTLVPADGRFGSIDLQVNEDDTATLHVVLEPQFSVTDQRNTAQNRARFLPVVRAGTPDRLADIGGRVAAALVQGANCRNSGAPAEGAAIYAFGQHDLSSLGDFIEGAELNPVALAAIRFDADNSRYDYRLRDLPPGDYTLGLFCLADADTPVGAEGLTALRNVERVLDGSDLTVDFLN